MRTDKLDSDFSKRLLAKMKLQDVSRTKLHKMTGISYEMIRRYVNDDAKPREDKMVLLAQALCTTASYLDYGIDVIDTSQDSKADFNGTNKTSAAIGQSNASNIEGLRYVPVLSFSQAKHLYRTKKVAISNSFEPVIGSFYSDNAYWITIEDDSMNPHFKRRDLVLIDPDLEAEPSDFVLASINDDRELLFRKRRVRGFDESTGKPYEQLVAEHEDYPMIDSRHTKFELCGVAIEYKRRLK